MKKILIAKILSPHGIKGEVNIFYFVFEGTGSGSILG